jgi:hypothetical protein
MTEMKTKCPNCSRVQTVAMDMANANVRCEECRGMFKALPLPKVEAVPAADEMPQFTHMGPGWWLTVLAVIGVLAAIVTTLHFGLAASMPALAFAGSVFVCAQIVNFLGYIAALLRYAQTHREPTK